MVSLIYVESKLQAQMNLFRKQGNKIRAIGNKLVVAKVGVGEGRSESLELAHAN